MSLPGTRPRGRAGPADAGLLLTRGLRRRWAARCPIGPVAAPMRRRHRDRPPVVRVEVDAPPASCATCSSATSTCRAWPG
jgi:hypothetical protein